MAQYAKDTTVSVAQSKAEIEHTLARYGADQFLQGWDATSATIGFRIANRQVGITVTLPDPQSDEFTTYMRGKVPYLREESVAKKMWEQACRQRWRALALIIKAKLEAVECGITTIEREFLADIRMPDGSRFWDHAGPEIERVYLTGRMPMLALPPGEKRK